MSNRDKILCLFDIDGTLTKARCPVESHIENFLLEKLKPVAQIGLVGGSDYDKVIEQMGGTSALTKYDYVFPENGLLAYGNGQLIAKQSIQEEVGEEKLQEFINFTLRKLSEVKLPCKRGTFIEFRTGMINVSPIGRSCSRDERNAFEAYDQTHKIRETLIDQLKKEFPDIGFKYSIGGQISFDVFPIGWDKTYCLRHISNFETVHFFGDKTWPGGNDFEIFEHERTVGHTVKSPQDTVEQLRQLFKL